MPSSVLNGEIPYRVLFPTKSLYPIAPKIFGCVCCARDVRPHRTKLDPKSLKCIFLGYLRVQKGYRCFCPTLNRYLVSPDVTFFEDMSFSPSSSSSCQGENDNLFIYEITSPISSSTPSSSVSLPSRPPITQVYSRQPPQQLSGTCSTPMTSSTINLGPSDDLPIAFQKGTRTFPRLFHIISCPRPHILFSHPSIPSLFLTLFMKLYLILVGVVEWLRRWLL